MSTAPTPNDRPFRDASTDDLLRIMNESRARVLAATQRQRLRLALRRDPDVLGRAGGGAERASTRDGA